MKKMIQILSIIAFALFSLPSLAHDDHDQPTPSAHLVYKQGSLHIHSHFLKSPSTSEEAFLKLETHDGKTHKLVEIQDDISIEIWMPDMNHGSSPVQIDRSVDSNGDLILGTYIARSLYFVMGGKWDVKVTLKSPSGENETQTFSLQIKNNDHNH